MAASAFTIKELTGDKREIRLAGRALPYRPFTLKTNQRVELTWYPGNPEATATILGPSETPTTVIGTWKDRFLGEGSRAIAEGNEATTPSAVDPPFQLDGETIVTVEDAVDLMDDVVRVAQLVEVTWFTTRRQGFLTSFEKKWQTTHDVEWSMEFQWINRGDSPGPAVFITGQQLGDTASSLDKQMASLDDIVADFPINRGLLESLQDIQQSIEDAVNSVQDAVQNFTDKILSPVRAIRGILSTLRSIDDELVLLFQSVESQVSGALNSTAVTNRDIQNGQLAAFPQADIPPAVKISEELWRQEMKAWAREFKQVVQDQRDALEAQITSDLAGIHVARAGEDLRDVSRIFYDTPFEWRRIMIFNDLDNAELEPGQVVLVPKRNPDEAGQGEPGT